MKRKLSSSNGARRGRRKKTDWDVSSKHRQIIRKISELSQVSLSRVVGDVLELGISQAWHQYQPVIEMEKRRALRPAYLESLLNESASSEDIGRGIPEEPDRVDVPERVDSAQDEGSDSPSIDDEAARIIEGSSLVVIGRGPGAEDDTDSGSVDAGNGMGELAGFRD